jgi:hypothetical protein
MSGERLDRRAFLRAAGGAGVGAAVALGWPGAAAAAASPRPSIFDLRFRLTHQYRPFALLAPGFEQHDSPGGRPAGLVRTNAGPVAPFAAVVLDVAEHDPGATLLAGLVQDENNSVLAVHDAAAGRVRIEVTRGGSRRVVGEVQRTLTAPFAFAFAVCENQVTVLVDEGSGFQPLLTRRDQVSAIVDLRRPDVLAAHRYGYGVRGSGSVTLERARAGYFGQAGVRDPHVVQWPDGTPFIRDGKLYLTLTNAGLGFFQQAHWGVWTLDLADPTKLEQVANLYFARDGVIVGDHAGQIVYDDRQDAFHLAMSSWGDFAFRGVRVQYATVRANVLEGVHVIPTQRLPLPTTVSSWDPALTRIRGRWHVGFVESPSQTPFIFHPALAVGRPGGGFTDLTLAGRDESVDQTEGTILQRVGREWYLLASDGDAREYRVYDLRVRHLGNLNAPYGTNIPHPMVVPIPERRRTRWMLLTFNGTQYAEPVLGYGGHGDFLVMEAQRTLGYEFPPREP